MKVFVIRVYVCVYGGGVKGGGGLHQMDNEGKGGYCGKSGGQHRKRNRFFGGGVWKENYYLTLIFFHKNS